MIWGALVVYIMLQKLFKSYKSKKSLDILEIKESNLWNLKESYFILIIDFMILLYNRMNNLSVAVLKPHYVDRT